MVAYAAIIFGIEPAYNDIKGKWLTNGEYATVHRVAVSETLKGKGKFNAQFPQITVSNIDQITRKFISDYQMNELMKYVYALKRHMYKLIKLKCTLYC